MKTFHWLIIILGTCSIAVGLCLTTDLTNTIICLAGAVVTSLGIGMIYRDRVFGFSRQKAAIASAVEKWKQIGS